MGVCRRHHLELTVNVVAYLPTVPRGRPVPIQVTVLYRIDPAGAVPVFWKANGVDPHDSSRFKVGHLMGLDDFVVVVVRISKLDDYAGDYAEGDA